MATKYIINNEDGLITPGQIINGGISATTISADTITTSGLTATTISADTITTSGLTATTISADTLIISGSPIYQSSYNVYTALLTQTGTSAPTVVVLENTLDGVVTWSYSGTGDYYGNLTGAFTLNKTYVMISGVATGSSTGVRKNNNQVSINTYDFISGLSDGKLEDTTIEIRVYN